MTYELTYLHEYFFTSVVDTELHGAICPVLVKASFAIEETSKVLPVQ